MHRRRSKRVFEAELSTDEETDTKHHKMDTDSSTERIRTVGVQSVDQPGLTITPINSRNTTNGQIQPKYQPLCYIYRTIGENNRSRLSILPIFPTTADDRQFHLLLANVPTKSLSKDELLRRGQVNYISHYRMEIHTVHYQSDLVDYYQRNYVDLMNRFQIDVSILDCNYIRLRQCLNLFADERIRRLQVSQFEVQLPENERPIAMEFFLQIDVDLFYMKSFSCCHTERNSSNESLFSKNEPDFTFAMKPCRKCELCCGPYYTAYRPKSPIKFGTSQKFVCLNGYTTILNASASCDTHSIIYILKCPCGEHEFVGETNLTLYHCLSGIRKKCMLSIHEFLLGEKNIIDSEKRRTRPSETSTSIEYTHLYQHSVRCPKAMQMFLNYNRRYWRFVPMLIIDAQQQNTIFDKSTTTIREDQPQRFIDNLPPTPHGYQFSDEQHDQQTRFFQRQHNTRLPDIPVNLYNATIIAVLPENVSTVFRQFIQTLFITHGETNLNSIGHLVMRNNNTNNIPTFLHTTLPRGEWCRNLVRPSSR